MRGEIEREGASANKKYKKIRLEEVVLKSLVEMKRVVRAKKEAKRKLCQACQAMAKETLRFVKLIGIIAGQREEKIRQMRKGNGRASPG